MDNHTNRTILANYEISSADNDQEIVKLGSINTIRSIENTSLQFIGVPREQEFIDHSLLNPEYLSQFPNGFIVDFIPNGVGVHQTQQIIADAVNAELAFEGGGPVNDEHDRGLTAALLQLVNKPCQIKIGNETQVIVANKEQLKLNFQRGTVSESIGQDNIHSVSNHQALQNDLIKRTSFDIYEHDHPEVLATTQHNPPLPPLTPIRKLTRQRKNSLMNAANDIQFSQINEIPGDEEIDSRQRPLTRKSLPHKKRISKKLKNIERIEAPPPIRKTVISQDNQQIPVAEVETNLAGGHSLFSCEICSAVCSSQLEFFTHLKAHYEPTVVTVTEIETMPVPIQPTLPPVEVSISNEDVVDIRQNEVNEFANFSQSNNVIGLNTEQNQIDDESMKVYENSQDSHLVDNNALPMDEVEFSEAEDMLEGIRGVVDKVQESVENDSNDGNDWYSSSSMNENDACKEEDINPNLNNSVHNLNTSVDNFTVFFKNELDVKPDTEEIGLPTATNLIQLPNDLSSVTKPESYEVPDETRGTIISSHGTPMMTGFGTMLNDDISLEDKDIKEPVKRTTRKRTKKPIQPQLLDTDDEFTDSDGFEDDGNEKYKKRRACSQCDKVFNSSNAYKYHVLSHTGERPHQCEVCGKSFFAQSALKVHMRLHSGAKPYECEYCKRAFRQWGDLKYHTISIHTDERNFVCEFCGKAFARRYSLVIHRRIHTSERNYKCEFCPKTFRASSYLQNHRKVHTGEKPYECPTCGKKFRVSGDLKRHIKIHTREKRVRPKKSDSKKEDTKTNTKDVISIKSKLSASCANTQPIKTEQNVLLDLNLLAGDLQTTPNAGLVKVEQNVNRGTMIYSDEAVEIFKTEGVDRYVQNVKSERNK